MMAEPATPEAEVDARVDWTPEQDAPLFQPAKKRPKKGKGKKKRQIDQSADAKGAARDATAELRARLEEAAHRMDLEADRYQAALEAAVLRVTEHADPPHLSRFGERLGEVADNARRGIEGFTEGFRAVLRRGQDALAQDLEETAARQAELQAALVKLQDLVESQTDRDERIGEALASFAGALESARVQTCAGQARVGDQLVELEGVIVTGHTSLDGALSASVRSSQALDEQLERDRNALASEAAALCDQMRATAEAMRVRTTEGVEESLAAVRTQLASMLEQLQGDIDQAREAIGRELSDATTLVATPPPAPEPHRSPPKAPRAEPAPFAGPWIDGDARDEMDNLLAQLNGEAEPDPYRPGLSTELPARRRSAFRSPRKWSGGRRSPDDPSQEDA